ncbi:MAG: type VI secretion system contractile sheath large subunit [Planctomycetota bacterium]
MTTPSSLPHLPLELFVAAPLGAPLAGEDSDGLVTRLAAGASIEDAFAAVAPVLQVAGKEFAPRSLEDFLPTDPTVEGLLTHGAFIELEAAWRGLDRLLKAVNVPGPWPRNVTLLSAPRGDLVGEATHYFGSRMEESASPQLILVDRSFGASPDDADELEALCGWGRALSALVIGQASPAMFGVTHAIHVPALGDLDERMASLKSARLQSLRSDDSSRWLTLVFNRWLTRDRHGATSTGGEEKQTPRKPETMPFGQSAWLAAERIVASYGALGHAGAAPGFFEGALLQGLGRAKAPGASKDDPLVSSEVSLEDACATAMLRSGFSPLMERPEESVGAFASLANFHRPGGPSLSTSCTASHQLFAASATAMVRAALKAHGRADEAELKAACLGWIDALGSGQEAGDPSSDPDMDPVDCTLEGDLMNVRFQPALTLEGHSPRLEFSIPVG